MASGSSEAAAKIAEHLTQAGIEWEFDGCVTSLLISHRQLTSTMCALPGKQKVLIWCQER